MILSRKKKPSLHEIDSLFRSQLAPELAGLESDRKFIFHLIVFIAAGFVILYGVLFLSLSKSNNHVKDIGQLLGFAAVLPFLTIHFATRSYRRAYNLKFKEQVMRKVLGKFFPELKYEPEDYLSKSLYDESGLFKKELDTYTGNDLFLGKLGDVDFQFSELLCQYTTGSGKNRQTHTAFRGFFFIGEFHRNFFFRTTIQPDKAESLFGIIGRGLQRIGSGNRLVDLEDPDFEKLFVVTSDDQVEARFILTPVFMEKLKNFKNQIGNNIHLCFVNGKMFLGIETTHDYFEPKIFGEILSRQDLMKFIEMLCLLMGVAEDFLHHPKFAQDKPKMPPLPVLKKKLG